ncbi:MAG: TrbI/VirB10 family protein [Mojavia pulchra JT2-VF2]|jgi:hypothetical protein|uniref:TrbI/VirB10 family protein n=1 Tax=Mojavia pulchra JT2-VF2 TaxID=287848 RepID=A0A951PWD4_9NOST|nr:TrbI/VirB10 family protein [Mojavia pulchra JT2-VF2]
MTRYSVSAEVPQEILISPAVDNYQPEEASSDWESRMAKLVGLEDEEGSLSASGEKLEDSTTSQPSPSQQSKVATEQRLSSNPFAKLGLVGTATLAVVLFAGVFLTQLMGGSNQKPKKKNIIASEVAAPVINESPRPELEIEALKTKLALTEQSEAVKLAQQQLRNTQVNSLGSSRDGLTAGVPRTSKSTSKVDVPKIVTVERIVQVPQSLQPTNYRPALPNLVAARPDTQPSVKVTPSPTMNPLQTWANLAKLGSYGQVTISDRPRDHISASANNPNVEQQATNPEVDPRQIDPTQTPESIAAANKAEKETLIANKETKQISKSLAVGNSVKAVLATAVFGAATNSTSSDSSESQKNVFVVRLTEPLTGADGQVVIPAETELLTEIRSLSEQGLLQLDVVKAITKNNGEITETSLPPNAMTIRAPQGKPLVAQQFPNQGSSIAGMDVGLFVLGGLGKAAELFNRTEAQVVTTTSTGTIVSNTNPTRNILAGVFEGGMNTVVPQIAQRNQQAISEMMQRTNVWFLPAGTEVEIYVNQSMQF